MKKIIIALSFLGLVGGSLTSAFAGYFNDTPAMRCDTQITRTLQVGSQNNDVYTLQSMLKQGGYLYVVPNSYFGPSTKAAVKRFQSDNGLTANGIVGEATRNAVNERLCDTDVRGDAMRYSLYDYSSGVTFVHQYDPFVKVISPNVRTPEVYATPQEQAISFSSSHILPNNVISSDVNSVVGGLLPSTTHIDGTNIIFNPSTGYSYGITQKTGSLTIFSPVKNAVYKEGDTLTVSWTTDNMNASGFHIILENTATSQSKQVATVSGNSASFVLTKELLDAVCFTSCDPNQQASFKVVITTPVRDIAGITSDFRAAVAPITIKRPYGASATVRISTSKSPVDSGEKFRMYINVPTLDSWNTTIGTDSIVRMRAICLNNIQVSVAGIPCGQELVMPVSAVTNQSGVPVMITNTTWYKQEVIFEITITNPLGEVLGTAKTTVVASQAPINW